MAAGDLLFSGWNARLSVEDSENGDARVVREPEFPASYEIGENQDHCV